MTSSIPIRPDRELYAFKGKPFWIGAISPNSAILEVHPYGESEQHDFHTDHYFSQAIVDMSETGQCRFFWFSENGDLYVDSSLCEDIVQKNLILSQISPNPASIYPLALEIAEQITEHLENLKQAEVPICDMAAARGWNIREDPQLKANLVELSMNLISFDPIAYYSGGDILEVSDPSHDYLVECLMDAGSKHLGLNETTRWDIRTVLTPEELAEALATDEMPPFSGLLLENRGLLRPPGAVAHLLLFTEDDNWQYTADIPEDELKNATAIRELLWNGNPSNNQPVLSQP